MLQQPAAAELNGYLALTTDYVRRGVTQTDGDPTAQLAVDMSFDSGWFFGVWASGLDIRNGPTRQRDLETNYYLGYGLDLGRDWHITANAVAYEYPGTTGSIDYGHVEYALATGFRDWLWLEYAYSPDLYHTGRSTRNYDLYAEWPVGDAFVIGAGGGYYDVSELAGQGYGYWQAGITRFFSRASVDLRVHRADRSVFIVAPEERIGTRVSLSLRIPF